MATKGYALLDAVTNSVPPEQGGTGQSTAFPVGAVLFGHTDGSIRANSANLFWDNVGNRLGIGLNNPTGKLHIIQAPETSASPSILTLVGGAHTTLAAGIQATDVKFDLQRTVQFATGNIGTQTAVRILSPTYAFVGASTLDEIITVGIEGAPKTGANATVGSAISLVIYSSLVNADVGESLLIETSEIVNGRGAMDAIVGLDVAGGGSLGNQTAILGDLRIANFEGGTYTSTTNTRTVTNAATVFISEPPIAGANVTFTNGPYSLWVDSGTVRLDGNLIIQPELITGGSPTLLTITGGSLNDLANAEATNINIDLFGPTINFLGGGGAFTQRCVRFQFPFYSADAAQTIGEWMGISLENMPDNIGNLTFTDQSMLYFQQTTAAGIDENAFIRFQPLGISNGIGAVNTVTDILSKAGTVSLGNQTATLTNLNSIRLEQLTFSSTTLVRTVTNPATLYIAGAPVASTNVTFTNGPYSLWIDSGLPRIDSQAANGTVACVLTANSGPTGANTAVQEWLKININGTDRFIPCW